MNKTFNIAEYLQGLSKDLVNAFDKAAKNSHPQAILLKKFSVLWGI